MDLISRQAAIEKFEPWLKVDGYSEGELNMLKAVLYELKFLPSAQAEEHTEERTETHACDCISRQAAIDALLHNQELYSNNFGDDPIDKYTIAIIDNDAQTIAQLPSAQPESHEIGYSECANSTLKMWIDNVLTDGEYSHIMDKLNAYWAERRADGF